MPPAEEQQEGNQEEQSGDEEEEFIPPPPPPPNWEQVLFMQTQILQALAVGMLNPSQPPPPQQSRLAEFMRTKPPTFDVSAEPMEAEDWLRDIER